LHVRRYDWILIVAEEVVGSLFWFHPGVWWLLNRIQLSREQAVDFEVVRLTGNKQPYLDSLLEFARAHGRPRAVPAPLFLKESHLVQRVALLLKEVSMSRSRLAVSIISIFILLMGTLHLAAACFPLTGAPLPAQGQNSPAEVRAPQTTPIQVAGDIQESKLIFRVEPVYPEEAKRLGLNGIVKLRVLLNEEGQVDRIVAQAGHPMLIRAAFDAVTKWRYSPTFLNGKPVSVVTNVTCLFLTKETAAFGERSGDAKPSAYAPFISVPGSVVGGMTVRPKAAIPPPAREQIADNPIKPPRTEPIRIGNMVQESKLIHRVEPVYPEQALRDGIQGTVRLLITINEEGFVYELKAVDGNNPILEAAAIDAVKQWQYSPTLLNGEPVAAQTTVTVLFNMK
jgi:TonB family protein